MCPAGLRSGWALTEIGRGGTRAAGGPARRSSPARSPPPERSKPPTAATGTRSSRSMYPKQRLRTKRGRPSAPRCRRRRDGDLSLTDWRLPSRAGPRLRFRFCVRTPGLATRLPINWRGAASRPRSRARGGETPGGTPGLRRRRARPKGGSSGRRSTGSAPPARTRPNDELRARNGGRARRSSRRG